MHGNLLGLNALRATTFEQKRDGLIRAEGGIPVGLQADAGMIKKLATCQEILNYANRGFVVIVAWENTNGGAPHYATVQPQPENISTELKKLKLCNVSSEARTDMNVTMNQAFGNRQCEFYVNLNQKFRENYDNIQKLEKREE